MKEEMHQSEDDKFIPMTSISSGKGKEVSKDVYYYTNQIVNVIMIGDPAGDSWVLIDAGMPKSGEEILKVSEKRFGKGNKPAAIILTHGHFDHVGGLVHLINEWDVPVFAHPLEFLYLTGEKRYPEPDTTVEGGMLAKISSIYPIEPINISEVLQELPKDMSVPRLPEWQWVHVPGHSPGQIALYREKDGILIAGDAFITVEQDSLYKVLIQKSKIHGPPVYLTTNWEMAEDSVQKLAALNPKIAVTGHGQHMEGEELKKELNDLATNFKERVVPSHGKFVRDERKE
jgi:glyoxylase-like metal-dependent hydrolase (beta-lactamase superfamily II)